LEGNSVAFRSTLSAQHLDDTSGDNVRFADFSSVKAPGEYRLELDTVVSGDSFPIRKDAYDNSLLLTMRSLYGQRCGFDVNVGGGYAHPKCHMEAAGYGNSLALEDYGGASNSIVANHSFITTYRQSV